MNVLQDQLYRFLLYSLSVFVCLVLTHIHTMTHAHRLPLVSNMSVGCLEHCHSYKLGLLRTRMLKKGDQENKISAFHNLLKDAGWF